MLYELFDDSFCSLTGMSSEIADRCFAELSGTPGSVAAKVASLGKAARRQQGDVHSAAGGALVVWGLSIVIYLVF